MKTLGIAFLLALAGTAQAQVSGNQWVLNHFNNPPYYHYTSIPYGGRIITPSVVMNIDWIQFYPSCGTYCYDAWQQDPDTLLPSPNGSPDLEVAFVNITTPKQLPSNSGRAAAIHTNGNAKGWMSTLDVYLSNVKVAPMFPEFAGYTATNYDAFTFDGGSPSDPNCLSDPSCYYGWPSHVYAENVTVDCGSGQTCWSDAAFDVKARQFQGVNVVTRGHGLNTLKLWWPGPHYIVNSNINNDRYISTNPGIDGGLIWTWDCSKLHLIIYNSTFNGGSMLPTNKIGCQIAGQATIEYRSVDPRTTGEMHPMFQP